MHSDPISSFLDNRVVTCAGETATLDFMLHMIEAHRGPELARAVAAEALHATRLPNAKQRDINRGMVVENVVVREAVDLMEASTENPMSPKGIANHLGVSLRHLERLCARHLQCSPARYYKRMRLERAQRMLCQTGLSVLEIAVACGFVSQSHFAKSYSQCFGRSPTHDRVMRGRP